MQALCVQVVREQVPVGQVKGARTWHSLATYAAWIVMSDDGDQISKLGDEREFCVKYWGVTGSIASPLTPSEIADKVAGCLEHLMKAGKLKQIAESQWSREQIEQLLRESVPFHLRSSFGGNTTCFEITTNDSVMILDAGSGLRNLGADLVRRWQAEDATNRHAREAHLLLTHGHMDHTFAIPFAAPLFDPRNAITIWAPERVIESLHAVLRSDSELHGTFFPATYDVLAGIREFRTVEVGVPFRIGGTEITAYALNHPGTCVAYRFQRNGTRLVFASDHEHLEVPDLGLADFARDADLLYLDAQYFNDEYRGACGIGTDSAIARIGWGHSTVEAAVQTAVASGVGRLHLGHHDPARSDQALSRMEAVACDRLREAWSKANGDAPCPIQLQVVHEGLSLRL